MAASTYHLIVHAVCRPRFAGVFFRFTVLAASLHGYRRTLSRAMRETA